MASQPSFDPNFFTQSFTTQEAYERIFLSSTTPLVSRAINAYDPGSTWKIVTAMAGMETGKFKSNILLKTAPCIQYGGHCFPKDVQAILATARAHNINLSLINESQKYNNTVRKEI